MRDLRKPRSINVDSRVAPPGRPRYTRPCAASAALPRLGRFAMIAIRKHFRQRV